MKVGTSIRANEQQGDKLVRRKGRLYLINKRNPRRKRRQK